MSAATQPQQRNQTAPSAPLFGTSFDARFWLNRRASGYIGAALTWFLVLYELSVIVGVIVYPWVGLSRVGVATIACATALCILSLVAHGKAMLTDPGAVPQDPLPINFIETSQNAIAGIDVKSLSLCGRCRQFKPSRAHHCSRCGRCVVKMDHHCVWVNNCVGVGNTKFFILFNVYVLALTIYTLAAIIAWWLMVPHPSTFVEITFVVFSAIAAVFFGYFTASVLSDQFEAIRTGMTQIDRYKSEEFALSWLLPTDVWFLPSLKSRILGYVLEEELGDLRRRREQEAAGAVAGHLESDFVAQDEYTSPRFTPIDAFDGAGWAIERLAADSQVSDWCRKAKVL